MCNPWTKSWIKILFTEMAFTCSSELYNNILGCPLCEQAMDYKYLFSYTTLTFSLGFYIKFVRISALKSYCMMLCMILCVTLCMSWLNIVINKFVLLLSEIMVTWIFRHHHIVHEMHSIWFMWKVTEDINYKFFVNSEFSS